MLTTDYFKDLPTWELLNFTNKDFYVPTYQRGYRWEENQVKDLLKDLEDFVRSEKEDNYYLQPLVVRPKEWDDENNVKHTGWEVLDGQQRLTTMLLLMKCLNERNSAPAQLYNIFYARHSDLDFQKIVYDTSMGDQNYPNEKKNLDSFFVKKAKNIIQEWYDELKNDSKSSLLDDLRKCLFKEDSQKKVRFIWYDASSEPDFKNMDSIKLFNRLNGGKISLTNSELVKALFYIGFSQCTNSISDKFTFTSEWEIIERKLQDDMFWSFISPRNKYLDTRMDLLLDFTQQTKDNKDKSFSYRRYQTLFDSIFILPTIKEQRDRIKDLWMDIKNQFDTLVRWYENIDMYNYIGYLVECGINIADIQQHLKANLNLRSIIRTKLFRDFDLKQIMDLRYNVSSDNKKILNLLLLFNVETCCRHNSRFPFNLYRDGQWDLEHINPQTDNAIIDFNDKLSWLTDQALDCLERDQNNDKTAKELLTKGNNLLEKLKKQQQEIGNEFADYRKKVAEYYNDNNNLEKDGIDNLTLLNSKINRSYGNALFPSKKLTVMTFDQMGEYIPLCTRYLFLKYYSTGINATRLNMMRWSEQDQKDYQYAIIEYLTPIFNAE